MRTWGNSRHTNIKNIFPTDRVLDLKNQTIELCFIAPKSGGSKKCLWPETLFRKKNLRRTIFKSPFSFFFTNSGAIPTSNNCTHIHTQCYISLERDGAFTSSPTNNTHIFMGQNPTHTHFLSFIFIFTHPPTQFYHHCTAALRISTSLFYEAIFTMSAFRSPALFSYRKVSEALYQVS